VGPDPDVVRQPQLPPSVWNIVSGRVFEHTATGSHPLGGLPIRVVRSPGAGPDEVIDVVSNADGSYEVAGTARTDFVHVRVRSEGYRAPCPPGEWFEQRLDVHVVSRGLLTTTGAPTSMPTSQFTVVGHVTESNSGGVRPIAGATVAMFQVGPSQSPDQGDAWAETLTNSEGRYLFCWVGNSEIFGEVRASKDGYVPASRVGAPFDGKWVVDFELLRR
jgi:hypothetical protein